MNKIMLLALLAAAGCSKKASDCAIAVGTGMDRYLAATQKTAAGTPLAKAAAGMGDKLKAAMTQRCTEDKWQPQVVACVATVGSGADLNACQDKLNRDQRARLEAAVIPILRSAMGVNAGQMPSGVAGHPPVLTGNATGSGSAGAAAAPAPEPPEKQPAAGSGSGAAPAAGSGSGAAPAAGAGGW